MKRVSDISLSSEFLIEIQREKLRDWRVNRGAKIVFLAWVCLTMGDKAVTRVLASALLPF